MQIMINNQLLEVRDEKTVLEVAQREEIYIPTLCHHPALESYGACRLCLVEVKDGGKPGLTASCALPVTDGLVIETDSPRVRHVRGIVLKLIMAACPDVPEITVLAAKLGVESTPYNKAKETDGCVLCGQCVRICEQVGKQAIGFAFRGAKRKVTGPFAKIPDVCLGCRACENVCPVGLIKFSEESGTLSGEPYQCSVAMVQCAECGREFAPEPLLSHLQAKTGLEIKICPDCQKAHQASLLLVEKGYQL